MSRVGRPDATEPSALRYGARRVARHLRWLRTEGLARLAEEKRLDPVGRLRTAAAKRSFRRMHGVPPGTARPVYVVGLQRSGTNMLLRGLDAAPAIEVRNESDRTLFHRYRLRDDATLRRVIAASRHPIVLIKPLCDSHRVDHLLDLPGVPPGRAVWVVRDVDARARSAVAKFGDADLCALRVIAAGGAATIWQGGRLSESSVQLVRGFDLDAMTAPTAAALFWVLRNRLFFDLGLDRRDDVLLSSYDASVAEPEKGMRRLCEFLDFPYDPGLCAHIERRTAHGDQPLEIDPAVRRLAAELTAQLEALA